MLITLPITSVVVSSSSTGFSDVAAFDVLKDGLVGDNVYVVCSSGNNDVLKVDFVDDRVFGVVISGIEEVRGVFLAVDVTDVIALDIEVCSLGTPLVVGT